MSERTNDHEIELVYFDGCPNAERARENLRAVVDDGSWKEWNLSSHDTPDRFHHYGSPTVLVDSRDVTGDQGETEGMACRADGAPAPDVIGKALFGGG